MSLLRIMHICVSGHPLCRVLHDRVLFNAEWLGSAWSQLAHACWVMQELVQVESLAQVGVQLLLFTLGLEFSLSKLRAVRSVALIGMGLPSSVF